MKNLAMIAALTLMGTASATTFTAQVEFKANVANTCRLAGTNIELKTVPTQSVSADTDYTALKTGEAKLGTGKLFIIECTKGTDVTVKGTPNDGTATTVAAYNAWTTPADMKLAKGGDFLNGKYSMEITRELSTGQMSGDMYGGNLNFKPTAGQWGAPKGTYSGTLTVTFEYN